MLPRLRTGHGSRDENLEVFGNSTDDPLALLPHDHSGRRSAIGTTKAVGPYQEPVD